MIDNPEHRYREAWRIDPERVVDCTMRLVWSFIGAGVVTALFFAIKFVQDARLLH